MLIIPFSLKISKANLKSVLASMEEIQPDVPGKELFMEVKAELIPDGIGYEIGEASMHIVVEGQSAPVDTFEVAALEEITE